MTPLRVVIPAISSNFQKRTKSEKGGWRDIFVIEKRVDKFYTIGEAQKIFVMNSLKHFIYFFVFSFALYSSLPVKC